MEANLPRALRGGDGRPGKRRSGRIRRQNIARTFRVLPPRGEQEILDLVDLLRLRREAAGEAERGRCVRGNWTQEVSILLDFQAAELHGKA